MTATPNSDRELVLSRLIDAPREKVYRAWTDPAVLTAWFTPPPWRTTHAELDVRAGGANLIVMTGPDGSEMPRARSFKIGSSARPDFVERIGDGRSR